MQIFCRYFDRQFTYLQISATFMQIFCRYVDRQLTYLQLLCRYFADMLTDNQHICKISATFMQIFCRYCRPCCSYDAVLQQICDRYLQTFYIYVSLVRVYFYSFTYLMPVSIYFVPPNDPRICTVISFEKRLITVKVKPI